MSNPTELPDLDACPFCGNKAEMVDNGTGSWRVACLQSKGGCGATGRMTFDGGATAAREWNRRAQPEGEAPQAGWQAYALNLRAVLERGYKSLASAAMSQTRDGEAAWYAMGEALNTPTPAATLSPLCGAQHADSGKGEFRTCCDHLDCTTCAGRGGFYRMASKGGV